MLVGILTATIAASVKDVGHGQQVAAGYNVSRLGAELFTRYLLAVEAAGVLLFAALVGAAVIVNQGLRGNEAARCAFPRGRYE